MAAAVLIWMITGVGGRATEGHGRSSARGAASPASGNGPAPSPSESEPAVAVTVRSSTAERVVREVVVSGRTEPNRTVEIKAETEGRVIALGAERGSPIAEGERIVMLDVRDREARIAEAEALIAQRRLQYEAAQRLEGRQLVAEVQMAEARALLASAEALLEQMRLDLTRTSIVAPFEGMLDEREVELGDYVGIGDGVARIVDNDPLIAVGELSEREVAEIEVGARGRARLVNGEVLEGTVRYVAPVADPNTRTFRIELAVPNPRGALRAGITAEMRVPTAEIETHFLSPALLTLDDAGNIGVKTVDAKNRVRFYEVEIVRSASDGIWVSGLPEEALLITVGQGFVSVGQAVRPVRAAQATAP